MFLELIHAFAHEYPKPLHLGLLLNLQGVLAEVGLVAPESKLPPSLLRAPPRFALELPPDTVVAFSTPHRASACSYRMASPVACEACATSRSGQHSNYAGNSNDVYWNTERFR